MSDYKLNPDQALDVREILSDLANYRPRRRGWTWRKPAPGLKMGSFTYRDATEPLKRSVPLPPPTTSATSTPSPPPSSPRRLPPAALRTTSAACAWPPTTAPTTSW